MTLASLKSRAVAPTLHWLGLRLGLSAWLASRQRSFRILMFHGVDPTGVGAAAFEEQIDYLRRHFSIVPIERVVSQLEAGSPGDGREVALTFDDGLRNHVTTVYPTLEAFGVPATFFVCPGLIESGSWQWPYEVRSRLARLDHAARQSLASAVGAPDPERGALETWMKGLHLPRRRAVEAELRERTPHFEASPAERAAFDTLGWHELERLDPALITIGSHTSNHPILTRIEPDVVREEVAGSRRVLEERLGRRVDYFCYPDGAYDPWVVDCVRSHYRAAVTTHGGFAAPGDDLHLLGRIPTAPATTLFAWRLHRPGA